MFQRFEAIESRFPHEYYEEESVVQRGRIGSIDPMDRLIEAITNRGTRVKFEILDFKGELNPELFLDWIQDLEKYFHMEGIEEVDP
jgi:hypothetical protein